MVFCVLLSLIMKIVIDSRIPYIREAVASITSDAIYIDGTSISATDVRDADAMIVRTRTRCDERLLSGSNVRFIATATIGYDHLDTAYLQRAGITWTNCPGCNAASVAQYMRSVLLLLERDFGLRIRNATLGIVGCGHVGSRVRDVALSMGMNVLVCDPPAGRPGYVDIERIMRQADVITFHVPLTDNGPHPTRHLAGSSFFNRLADIRSQSPANRQPAPFIINTSRGAVMDNEALLDALQKGTVRQAVIDTWEHEPLINRRLLSEVYIGTPHIAGYSADGKVNANNMALAALCRFFGIPAPKPILPPPLPDGFVYTGNPLELYNPLDDSRRLKAAPELFEHLRGHYPLRREEV